VAVLAVMILIYLVAIGFTESRGGALSSASAVAVLVVTLLWRRAPLRLGPLLLAAAVLIAVWLSIYAVTAAHLGGRFQTQFFDDGGRSDAYAIMLSAIRDAPWQGYGYGAFVDMFYHRNDGAVWLPYNYAHNLYLGTLVDLGIPASLALFGAVALVTLACAKGIRLRRRNCHFPALGLAATILVATHGLVDSPLFMPANAATYSFILGLAYAQSFATPPEAH
jgi:O-antigen ligase